MRKFIINMVSALVLLGSASNWVQAAAIAAPDFPTRPIRFIIPFAAGGPVDVLGFVPR